MARYGTVDKKIDIAVKIRYFVSPFESLCNQHFDPFLLTSRRYVISTRSFFAFTRNGISFRASVSTKRVPTIRFISV